MHEEIGVVLLVRRLASVTLDVGHRAADDVVALLHRGEERLEPLLVRCAVLLVDFVRHRVERIEGVHPDATLKAGARVLTELSLHHVLRNQFVGALHDVQEPVDSLAGQR